MRKRDRRHSIIKHLGLTIGLFSVVISSLFHGLRQDLFMMLFLGGLFTSAVFYIIILFTNGSFKSKIFCTILLIGSIFIYRLTYEKFVRWSYIFYLKNNIQALMEVNSILIPKDGEISINGDNFMDGAQLLSSLERANLKRLRETLGTYTIHSSDKVVYFGLTGFLDARTGISFDTSKKKTGAHYTHLKGNWYIVSHNN